MPSSPDERKIRPTHIRLTSRSLAVYVDLGMLQSDLYTHYYWGQALRSWLKSWTAKYPRQKQHLIVSLSNMKVSQSSKEQLSQTTHDVAGSLDWTVDVL